MEITKDIIKKVAANARISITESETTSFLSELSEILDYFSKLKKLNTNNVEPSFHPIELKNITRDDSPKASLPSSAALSNTTHQKDNYFKGPKTL